MGSPPLSRRVRHDVGGRIYSITLPAPVPVNNFWSYMVKGNQTRSVLHTDHRSADIDSNSPDLVPHGDVSNTIWFGPEAREGRLVNWVQTKPGKGWNRLLRLSGLLEPWFDQTWQRGDLEPVE
jgi:hypothetical protein